jgi:hypothetical protein
LYRAFPQRLYDAGALYVITVVGMFEAVLVFIDFVRYAALLVECPGQAKAESAAVKKIKIRGRSNPMRPKLLAASFNCIESPP